MVLLCGYGIKLLKSTSSFVEFVAEIEMNFFIFLTYNFLEVYFQHQLNILVTPLFVSMENS